MGASNSVPVLMGQLIVLLEKQGTAIKTKTAQSSLRQFSFVYRPKSGIAES